MCSSWTMNSSPSNAKHVMNMGTLQRTVHRTNQILQRKKLKNNGNNQNRKNFRKGNSSIKSSSRTQEVLLPSLPSWNSSIGGNRKGETRRNPFEILDNLEETIVESKEKGKEVKGRKNKNKISRLLPNLHTPKMVNIHQETVLSHLSQRFKSKRKEI
jgi:hypothetical protein